MLELRQKCYFYVCEPCENQSRRRDPVWHKMELEKNNKVKLCLVSTLGLLSDYTFSGRAMPRISQWKS